MRISPIIHRELRVTTRRPITVWSRLAVAAGAGGLVAILLLGGGAVAQPAELGARVFAALSHFAYAAALLAGVLLTADCLSLEKREGTLGLLFLTDLKGRDVVLGKMFARSLHAFYSLLGVLPVMCVTALFGGVEPGELGRMAVTLLHTMFFSLALGMGVSVLCWREARAILTAAVAMFFLGYAFHYFGGPARMMSPKLAFEMSFAGAFAGHPGLFLWSCLWMQGLSWLILGITCWFAPRSWEEKQKTAEDIRLEHAPIWPTSEETPPPVTRERPRDAIEWMADRAVGSSLWLWVLLAFGGLGWVMSNPVFNAHKNSLLVGTVACVFFHGVFKTWITWETCRRFHADRRSGALEVLLATPVTVDEILGGQLASLRRQFFKPIVFVLGLDAAMLLTLLQTDGASFRHHGTFTWFLLAAIFLCVLDAAALGLRGLWMGLSAKRSTTAMVQTVGQILVLPNAVCLVALLPVLMRPGPAAGFNSAVMLWFFCSLTCAAAFGLHAWSCLHTHFRELATRHCVESAAVAPSP